MMSKGKKIYVSGPAAMGWSARRSIIWRTKKLRVTASRTITPRPTRSKALPQNGMTPAMSLGFLAKFVNLMAGRHPQCRRASNQDRGRGAHGWNGVHFLATEAFFSALICGR